MAEQSKVIRARGYRWEGVPHKAYKTEGSHFHGITRQTLLGEDGTQSALNHQTRYFEIAPGGYSSLERHEHTHTVVILRGEGELVLGRELHRIAAHDCIYIAPQTFHQFHATGDEPLGFLCIVDRERDRPHLPDEQELAELRALPGVGDRVRT
ncbi:quercetin dioxygenase-like cupin family protein [Alkalispirillum mobile]|uniref:Quercetin dioxygenase-like cupin family protein n=1 Tax=Alkalispirillum mobile TaxID=85925 RepID=A0A498C3C7_9GAMM|nr:cupin domain-containing protein [Alkalispirillum mobile]RLK50135.1 quercetin dioxygenase-like cupin family protein [Alkalispirillum mobile]